MALDDILPALRNAKGHSASGIHRSIDRFGLMETPMVDERTGRLLAGHGRIADIAERFAAKKAPPRGVEVVDGVWRVPVQRGVSTVDDVEADAYVIASNQLVIAGGWQDEKLLAQQLREHQATDAGLAALGFSNDDLAALLARLERDDMAQSPIEEARHDPRLAKVDLIFTQGTYGGGAIEQHNIGMFCCFAIRSGWTYGIMSARKTAACAAAGSWKLHRPIFIDNEYHDYDHARHLEVVSHWKPRYCTVRDWMSPEQCAAAGIEYYPLGQIIDWADELSEAGAENVMLIPKVDNIDAIPERFMLGYSVPSSYGATPLPTEAFRGRRVHLLGGSAISQMRYFMRLADEVVSVDNNHIMNIARFGQFIGPDLRNHSLSSIGVNVGDTTNPYMISMALSCGYIGAFYGRRGVASPDEQAAGDYREER